MSVCVCVVCVCVCSHGYIHTHWHELIPGPIPAPYPKGRVAPEDLKPGGKRYSSICIPNGLARTLSAECGSARTSAATDANADHVGVDPHFVNTASLYDSQVLVCVSVCVALTRRGIAFMCGPATLLLRVLL